jgi:aminocarboxymuconate-semialdehyde decarboxylase
MRVIDFHNHFYPPSYIAALRSGKSSIEVTEDADGNPVLHYPGDYNVAVPGHRDIAYRQSVLDGAGVDMQVLTFTSPGTHVERPDVAASMAAAVNDDFASIIAERGDRFTALATLPLCDAAASVREFERATDQLGLPGAMLFSNVNGTALSDERFWPLYEQAAAREAVLYIHPIHPVGVEAMTEWWLMPLVGFLFDTTLAASKLVYSGVVERFPGIRWVLCHLGGAVPYLAERLDRGYEAFEECRENISRPPSTFLREMYYDTVNFDPAALDLAIRFAGADHVVAGSDYPHMIGSIEQMLGSLASLDLSEADREAIMAGNAARLLGLEVRSDGATAG